jgi:hypothetical protein
MKRDPNTTSASPRSIGASSAGDVARVVLEIGVLDHHDVTLRVREAGADGGALAAIGRMEEHADLAARDAAEDVPGAVERAVVDDEDLLRVRQRLHALQDLPDARRLVVDRHDDRKLHRNVPRRISSGVAARTATTLAQMSSPCPRPDC